MPTLNKKKIVQTVCVNKDWRKNDYSHETKIFEEHRVKVKLRWVTWGTEKSFLLTVIPKKIPQESKQFSDDDRNILFPRVYYIVCVCLVVAAEVIVKSPTASWGHNMGIGSRNQPYGDFQCGIQKDRTLIIYCSDLELD